LIYLRLTSVEMSLKRVRQRVEAGGHGIPEDVIRRRFAKSADYLETIYKSIVDEWYIWDSLEGEFRRAESDSTMNRMIDPREVQEALDRAAKSGNRAGWFTLKAKMMPLVGAPTITAVDCRESAGALDITSKQKMQREPS
jgi:hypothetical protein